MATADEDAPKKTPRHELGEDLSRLSVSELGERIVLLCAEIVRLEEAIGAKQASADAAAAFFRT